MKIDGLLRSENKSVKFAYPRYGESPYVSVPAICFRTCQHPWLLCMEASFTYRHQLEDMIILAHIPNQCVLSHETFGASCPRTFGLKASLSTMNRQNLSLIKRGLISLTYGRDEPKQTA